MPIHNCPCCRCSPEDGDLDAQLSSRAAAWEAECVANGWPIRGGRVSEIDAAKLLGMAPTTLAGKRKSHSGPRAYRLPVDGSRWSYNLAELAAWESAHQEGDSWS
jgi:hypothetical protein